MNWITIGAFYCAASVAAGAFGAHGLEARLDARALDLWETASRYLMYGGLGLLAVGALDERWSQSLNGPGSSLAIGGLIFSGTVFALALGGPRWLGAVTPLGGLGMIVGFAWLAISAWRAM
jgi:uncharacterized membrane protein YgdD (TMEM256/DUF423 family)